MIHDLMERAIRGDEGARYELLEFYRDDLRRFIQARLDPKLGVRVDASDVVQDAMFSIWRRLDDYFRDPPMAYVPWIRQITSERLIDIHRHHVVAECRGVEREERLVNLKESTDGWGEEWFSSDSSPSNRLVRRETEGRLNEALLSLPERDSEIIRMRYIEQIGPAAIATRLGISESAVKSRLVRALLRLRGQMGSEN